MLARCAVFSFVLQLSLSAAALAQTVAPPPDVVILRDGGLVRGTIVASSMRELIGIKALKTG